MQAPEEQNQGSTAPEIPPQGDSEQSKPGRGGKRAGAGRKPDLVKRMIRGLKPATAMEVLSTVNVEKVIGEIFAKGSLTLKQRTLADLWDRAYGKPAQSVALSGGLLHAHATWRPLSSLTDEEVALLDSISKKLLPAPAENASQDAPQNQMNQSQPSKRKW
jgi:hypothetical protein